MQECSPILDLGTGTANTIAAMPRDASGGVRLAEKMLRKAQGKVTGRARSVGWDPLGYWQKPTRWEWDLTEVDTAWQAGNEGTATGWEQGGIR